MKFAEENKYINIVSDIIHNGSRHVDRTGVGTRALFGKMMEFDLTEGKIPLPSTRKVPTRFLPIELVWFISGSTDIKFLLDNNVNIWNSWVIPETAVYDNNPRSIVKHFEKQGVIKLDKDYEEVFNHMDTMGINSLISMLTGKPIPENILVSGSIGEGAYGAQWRKWDDTRLINYKDDKEYKKLIGLGYKDMNDDIYPGLVSESSPELRVMNKKIDQLADAIELIKNNPHSRRIIVSAWNAGKLDLMALPPCFVKGSLVSTPNGYREISEIKEGDLVYSDKMKVRRVTKTYKTPYEGDLIGLGVSGMSNYLISTPCHPHKVKDKDYQKAIDIKEHEDYLVMPFNNPNNEEEIYSYEVEINHNTSKTGKTVHKQTLTIEDCFVIGYFIGNGWYMKNSGHRICFSIPNHKVSNILPKIRNMVKVNLKYDTGSVSTYETRNERLGFLFEQFGHLAENKHFPEWVFKLPDSFKSKILEGLYEADGHRESDNKITITTVSRKLSLGVQRLAGSLGQRVGISFQRRPAETVIEGRIVKQQNTYTIHVNLNKDTVDKRSHFEDKTRFSLVTEKTLLSFDEKSEKFVYNLEVEEDHTYIVDNIATHNCHTLFQFNVREDSDSVKYLSTTLFSRSQDFLVGTLANIAQYSILTHMVAQVTGCVAEKLTWFGSNVHIYENQVELALSQVDRFPYKNNVRVELNKDIKNIDDFKFEDIVITGYDKTHEPIKYPVAV